ncbi:MAG: 4Fe-4S binding protein [Candidatus Omnitrophica bacterium]|jgi:NAD-dependent dihydropyrimidine dehydrogenase PreA subunit|nr:4Fe-4S binding protein [Candidatus Omnitrophota bacterium]MDD5660585.1 4Fe-4S binding protein [Candidatus Omnitrophota bacterium]
MSLRKIINIDPDKCNGCALCIPNCPEGAIQIIDQKARLVSDLFCDGLGACIGHCPKGAISIEEREAVAYDERRVMENIIKQGVNVIKAHLFHLKDHNEAGYLKQALDFLKEKNIEIKLEDACNINQPCFSCPGSKAMDFRKKDVKANSDQSGIESFLAQWPVQLRLVPVHAPYFEGADILIAADCLPFAYANFHQDLLKGRILLVGCPKLDDISLYKDKLKQIFTDNNIKSVTYAHMEVPCCFGLIAPIKEAISSSGREIPFEEVTISIKGEKLS